MTNSTIDAEDLRQALEQHREIDLVQNGAYRITYDMYLQLFHVYDGSREHWTGDTIVGAANAHNDLMTGE